MLETGLGLGAVGAIGLRGALSTCLCVSDVGPWVLIRWFRGRWEDR